MAGLQLTGLASGFDWQSLVDQLMAIERAPATRLAAEQTRNTRAQTALADLGTRLSALRTAADALQTGGLFTGRKAVLSGTGWSANVASGAPAGNHVIAVSQLATATRREGTLDIAEGLAATADVSGLTLATLPTGMAVTAGEFSINGARVAVNLGDSLQDVFDAIATATGGLVTAAYDGTTDRVTLSSTDEISLGAANDTSNLLRVLKLGNNGTGTVTSNDTLGTMRLYQPLNSAGLRTAIDGDGTGEFTINGVTVAYDVKVDSLSTVLKRINQSGAGVIATYDALKDRVGLSNQGAGDIGLAIAEAPGGLLGALGLTGGNLVRGLNTEFSVDGGPMFTGAGTTLDEATHGIPGLELTVTTAGTQTITIEPDIAAPQAAIQGFITAYNNLQSFVDDNTKITSTNGEVTAAVLASNREVQGWASELRRLAFATVGEGTLRLESLGIDFEGTGNRLAIRDRGKLEAALRERAGDVADFFQAATTGFAGKFAARVTAILDRNDNQQERLTRSNASLNRQIADLDRRLEQQRTLLESSFIRMEEAQARIQQQSTMLERNFFNTTSTN